MREIEYKIGDKVLLEVGYIEGFIVKIAKRDTLWKVNEYYLVETKHKILWKEFNRRKWMTKVSIAKIIEL